MVRHPEIGNGEAMPTHMAKWTEEETEFLKPSEKTTVEDFYAQGAMFLKEYNFC